MPDVKKFVDDQSPVQIILGPTGFSEDNKIMIGSIDVTNFVESVTVDAQYDSVTRATITLNLVSVEAALQKEAVGMEAENKLALRAILQRLADEEKDSLGDALESEETPR